MEQKFYIDKKDHKITYYKDNKKYYININDKQLKEKFAIVGSRSIKDTKFINIILDSVKFIFGTPSEIISSGAIGVDSIGEKWAIENNINTNILKPDWVKYGKKASFIMNEDIIKQCDICIAIWDGISNDTKNDIELCKKYKKDLILFNASDSSENDFIVFTYKEYNNQIQIKSDAPKTSLNNKKHIHNRWLPQPGIINV
ncbi:DUF2493 domain-containing protein [bacterium]|nr:DUF2493 domain-containing protein [bacterium]